MMGRELRVDGAVAFTPQVFDDERGSFSSPLQEKVIVEYTQRSLFAVKQMSTTKSKIGVVRGIHFTALPDSMAKYVTCVSGRAVDILVDVRVGSPTFRKYDRIELGGAQNQGVYIPAGVGHFFVALEPDTIMTYLLSAEYDAEKELAICPLDSELGFQLPISSGVIMSERDKDAPTFGEAYNRGLLPSYEDCVRLDHQGRK
jgi:epimerase EvaD